jgi:lipopolysaccharide biosynthesis protein
MMEPSECDTARRTLLRALSSAPRVCFFAHFDEDNVVGEHVHHYLHGLRDAGFAVLFLTATELGDDTRSQLTAIGVHISQRPNQGMDFGMWAHALRTYSATITGDLLLANDSVYGPIGGLREVMERFQSCRADYFGLVESFEHTPHLQSWFLLFKPHVYRSAAFREVFDRDFGSMTKRQVIRAGELGLARALSKAGFRYEAVFSPRRVCTIPSLCRMNPSVLLWRELPVSGAVPFIKIQALRDNPYGETDQTQWKQVVGDQEPDLVAHIERHLSRAVVRSVGDAPLEVALSRLRHAVILPGLRSAFDGGMRVGPIASLTYTALRSIGLTSRRVRQAAVRHHGTRT